MSPRNCAQRSRSRPVRPGREFKDGPAAEAAFARRAVEISGRVENEIANGTVAIIPGPEAMENRFAPFAGSRGRQLVNHPQPVRPTVVGRSVNISSRIKKHRAVRKDSVRCALKGIQGLEIPLARLRRSQLKDNPAPVQPAGSGRSENASARSTSLPAEPEEPSEPPVKVWMTRKA